MWLARTTGSAPDRACTAGGSAGRPAGAWAVPPRAVHAADGGFVHLDLCEGVAEQFVVLDHAGRAVEHEYPC
jgi:hypothetical protein